MILVALVICPSEPGDGCPFDAESSKCMDQDALRHGDYLPRKYFDYVCKKYSD